MKEMKETHIESRGRVKHLPSFSMKSLNYPVSLMTESLELWILIYKWKSDINESR